MHKHVTMPGMMIPLSRKPTSFLPYLLDNCQLIQSVNRVRKYAKFGVFYAKIVQMTPQRLRRDSLQRGVTTLTKAVWAVVAKTKTPEN